MRRIAEWALLAYRYADVLVALILALTVAGLDVLGITSTAVLQNAMMATLAVVAFVLLRDRVRSDARGETIAGSLSALAKSLDIVRIVSGNECTQLLAEARRTTSSWTFKGSTGAYVRAVTLPECVESARQSRKALRFRLEILDPTDEKLCAQYVGLHQRLATRPDSPERDWTTDGTQRELFATILAAVWHQQRYERLDIEVSLSSAYSLLRYEMSTDFLIITQRGPEFPATVIGTGTATYDSWETELHVSFRQARRLPLDRVRDIRLSNTPGPEEIRSMFETLQLPLPSTWQGPDLIELRDMALTAISPYDGAASWS